MRKFILLILSVLFITGCQMQNNDQLLQGTWISIDDEKSSIEFIGNKKIDLYEGEKLSEGVFTLEEKGEGFYLSVSEDEEVFEYKIEELSNNNLNLIFLPRGNILKYKKNL